MVDIAQSIGLTLVGIAYLLHLRWWHKPKTHDHSDGRASDADR